MITGAYAALCGLLLLALSARVIAGRRHYGAAFGDGDNTDLGRRIRAQANFTEYTPIFLVVLYFCELSGVEWWTIHLLGILFVIGRAIHAYGISFAENYAEDAIVAGGTYRQIGMGLTLSTIAVASIVVLTLRTVTTIQRVSVILS